MFSWPALGDNIEGHLDGSAINVHYGVWGKAKGAATDYRWLARTAGFDLSEAFIGEWCDFGAYANDEIVPNVSLVNSFGVCYLIHTMEGRADSSGRAAKERVILQVDKGALPQVLAALILAHKLDEVKSDWHSEGAEDFIDNPTYCYPAHELAAFELTPSRVKDLMGTALAALHKAFTNNGNFDKKRLSQAYKGVVSQNLVSAGPKNYFDALALVAFMLPLPFELAERLVLQNQRPPEKARMVGFDSALKDGKVSNQSDEFASWIEKGGMSSENQAPTSSEPKSEFMPLTDSDLEVGLWGASGSGKTIFLGRMLGVQDVNCEIHAGADNDSQKFASDMDACFHGKAALPDATEGEGLQVQYDLNYQGQGAVLRVDDRRGEMYTSMHKKAVTQLVGSKALIFLVDVDAATPESRVSFFATLKKIRAELSLSATQRDNRPVAFCLSKVDTHIRDTTLLGMAQHDPDAYVERYCRAATPLIRELKKYFGNVRMFPVSALGVKSRFGRVSSPVYIDNLGISRVEDLDQYEPLNVVEPIKWLLQQCQS